MRCWSSGGMIEHFRRLKCALIPVAGVPNIIKYKIQQKQ